MGVQNVAHCFAATCRRARLFTCIVAAATAIVACRPAMSTEQQLVYDVIVDVRQREYVAASRRFHVPPAEGVTALERERRYIQQALTVLTEEFGEYDAATALKDEPAAMNVSVLAGDAAYWRRHTEVVRYMYQVKFARAGDGFILIEVCDIVGHPEVREFGFGLAVSRPDARARIAAATKRLMELVDDRRSRVGRPPERSNRS